MFTSKIDLTRHFMTATITWESHMSGIVEIIILNKALELLLVREAFHAIK